MLELAIKSQPNHDPLESLTTLNVERRGGGNSDNPPNLCFTSHFIPHISPSPPHS